MRADNVVTIDSESWGVNGFNGDGQLVLVQTRTPSQAQDLFSYISGAANFPTTFSVPGYTSADARFSPNADSNGFFNGVISFQTGNVYMTLWLNFTNSFDVSTAQSWAVQELNLLTQNTQNHWGFPIPQVSTPSLPAFSPGTCPSAGLTGCLITTPSGSTAGTSGGGASVRDIAVSDFADAVFADRQGYELAWLTADGAKDAATESWTDANGAAATDYVLRFGSSRQAQAAALQMTGDSLEGSQSCSVLSLPNLTCMVLPQNDNNGQVPIRIVAWSGPYELDLEFTQTDKADTADALTWAQAQLQMLAGG
jgi:hypothetical protein